MAEIVALRFCDDPAKRGTLRESGVGCCNIEHSNAQRPTRNLNVRPVDDYGGFWTGSTNLDDNGLSGYRIVHTCGASANPQSLLHKPLGASRSCGVGNRPA